MGYWLVPHMDSVTLSVRDIFMSQWLWLDSHCFDDRWPCIWPMFSAFLALTLNSLPMTHSGSPWQEKDHVTATQRLLFFLLLRPHEQSVKIIQCLCKILSQAKKVIDRTPPKIHGALRCPRTYIPIDYCVYDSQGLEKSSAECHTCLSKLLQRL